MIWIIVQVIIMNHVNFLHVLYFLLGLLGAFQKFQPAEGYSQADSLFRTGQKIFFQWVLRVFFALAERLAGDKEFLRGFFFIVLMSSSTPSPRSLI